MIGNGKKKAVDDRTEDVFIDLPRNVIDCILERMPVRGAARTSILSRQWRYIWATHPQLVLDTHFYEETIKNTPFVQYDFVNIINKILLLHRGPILKFILRIPNFNFDLNPDIDQWILFLSRSGIKELTIHISNHSPYKLPSCIFSCPELTNLKLFHCIIKPLPAFSSTPLLEKLIFVTCIGIDHYNICAPKLKFLHVHNALEFKSISFRNTPNLAVVLISQCSKVDNSEQGKNPINLNELLGSLPRIENLMLGGTFLKVLVTGTVPKRLPTTVTLLPNLCFHQIDFSDPDQISCALCLLRSSTNLRNLAISSSPVTDISTEPAVFCLLESLDCLDMTLDHLQVMKFTQCKGSRVELLFIKFLLARSRLLERMLIKLNGVDANEGLGS